jgi:hypothetical protein
MAEYPCCRHCVGLRGESCDWVRMHGKGHQMPCEVCHATKKKKEAS